MFSRKVKEKHQKEATFNLSKPQHVETSQGLSQSRTQANPARPVRLSNDLFPRCVPFGAILNNEIEKTKILRTRLPHHR